RWFFTEILGFPQVGDNGRGMLFFSTDVVDNHHMLAIRQAKEGSPMPEPEQIGWSTSRSKSARSPSCRKCIDALKKTTSRFATPFFMGSQKVSISSILTATS